MKVVRPGGMMLAFFSSNEKMTSLPLYNYRIQDPKTLLLVPRNTSRQIQYFNNRTLERLFQEAQSVKFFLSRDHLRKSLSDGRGIFGNRSMLSRLGVQRAVRFAGGRFLRKHYSTFLFQFENSARIGVRTCTLSTPPGRP